jgi:paraquat-inducible protein B
MQSLLTGQLYIDLDFHPDKPARFIASDPEVSEIPTIPTAVEELASKLERFPMDTFLADLAAISQSLNAILSSEAAQKVPVRLEETLAHLQSLSARLDKDGGPIITEMRADLVEMRKALEAVRVAMVKIGGVAEAGSPMVASLTKTSEELAKTAKALQGLTGEGSPTMEHLNSALQEVSRAARALRFLAETLEQQPEAVLKGKRPIEERK